MSTDPLTLTIDMKRIDNFALATIGLISLLFSILQVKFGLQEMDVSPQTDALWMFIFALLVAVWATKEPKQKEFSAPFEFGAFLYFVWPIVLPYYLVKTRGLEGVVLFFGFVALYYIPFISGLLAYVFYT
ncbi:hypothetical protein [Teredinibacter sp. KSP-S5-2]|uniref:hypothetical protein n=1 Tax=Teredinibacter sp. KSP-S5-2 TaxID=3034506 RepID=UPI0029342C71|nr:hypothetical protein [Teredinibacter sp. KSP-S5-2]WNO09149.1 hypothetical protein P5V12_19595 [Teredinibacter sp. KSP-S5-2]